MNPLERLKNLIEKKYPDAQLDQAADTKKMERVCYASISEAPGVITNFLFGYISKDRKIWNYKVGRSV